MNIKKMIKNLLKAGKDPEGDPYTDKTLADDLGISQSHLNRIKLGNTKNPKYQIVVDIKELHDKVCG